MTINLFVYLFSVAVAFCLGGAFGAGWLSGEYAKQSREWVRIAEEWAALGRGS